MKLYLLLFFSLQSSFVFAQQNNIDVLHYKFQIGLNDFNDSIQGRAEIKIKFLQHSNQIAFDLYQTNEKGLGMKVGKVDDASIRGVAQNENKIRLYFSKTFNAGDTATFTIPYSGIPADGLIISKTKYGKRSFFGDNWPNRGHNWLPCHDDPADKASVEFIITAPNHYQVIANGLMISETINEEKMKVTHWKEEVPISTKVMVIGVAEFAVDLAGYANNIPVYSWVYPENKNDGFYDYALAKDILPFFMSNVGPYGYKKLANVQSKTTFGGLENANTIFYSENSVTGTRKLESLLAHEIAHQWFGNMATEKSFGHLWLSEGFATYFTILYMENKYGIDTAIYMLKEDREQVIAHSKESNTSVVDTAQKDFMKLLNPNSYQKGGWVLHMLRKELGDSIFWKSIRKYYATYAGSIAGTEDLQKVFEETSGKDLNQFFRQWLYTSGQPLLEIDWAYDEKNKNVSVNIIQKQNELFHFPITILFELPNGEKQEEQLKMNKQTQTFTFPLHSKPLNLKTDPGTSLLFSGKITEKKMAD